MSKNTIKLLLLLDALLHTNRDQPRTTNELIQDVNTAWHDLFPDEPLSEISSSTVGRHIKSINASGLTHIATKKAMKEGYYRDKFPFDSAEFSLIAQALFQSPSISTEETITLMNKFLHRTDDLGEGYLELMLKQLPAARPPGKHSPSSAQFSKPSGSRKKSVLPTIGQIPMKATSAAAT